MLPPWHRLLGTQVTGGTGYRHGTGYRRHKLPVAHVTAMARLYRRHKLPVAQVTAMAQVTGDTSYRWHRLPPWHMLPVTQVTGGAGYRRGAGNRWHKLPVAHVTTVAQVTGDTSYWWLMLAVTKVVTSGITSHSSAQVGAELFQGLTVVCIYLCSVLQKVADGLSDK